MRPPLVQRIRPFSVSLMTRAAFTIAIASLIIYVGACFALYAFQRSFLYFPQARTAIPGTTLLKLSNGNTELNVTAFLHPNSDAVIYFGGNAEDVSRSINGLINAFPNRSIYALHYRGYGGSGGNPSEKYLVQDGILLFDKAKNSHSNITVIGRSLGSGVAIQVASQRKMARLVLITPYDSIQNIATRQFPIFPVHLLLKDKFESLRFSESITVKTLIIAAENDEVIPMQSTKTLLASFSQQKPQFVVIPNTTHNTIADSPDYIRLLRGTE
jgi:pimeloyl-ACP methyl ester carboxylesterase